MDPISIVVAALAGGASTGLTDVVSAAIKDGYAALKRILAARYSSVSTSGLETKPDSQAQQDAVKESLADAGAGGDTALVAAAKALLEAIKTYDPSAAEAAGVILTRINAGSVDVHDVNAAQGSTGLRAEDITVRGAFNVSGVDAGGRPESP